MALKDLLLRITASPPFQTKGAELEHTELDNNIVILGNELLGLSGGGVLEVYDNDKTYSSNSTKDPDYVVLSSKIWEFISPTDKQGIAPGTDETVWVQRNAGVLTHQRNRDTALAEGTDNEVTAAELKSHTDCKQPAFIPVEDIVDGTVAPPGSPAEVDGLTYLLAAQASKNILSIIHQVDNTIRYTFDSGEYPAGIGIGDYLHVIDAGNLSNNGSFPITAVNAGSEYVDVTNADRENSDDDELGSPSSPAKATRTHADWDGNKPDDFVKYVNSVEDNWIGFTPILGDRVLNKAADNWLEYDGSAWVDHFPTSGGAWIETKVTLSSAQIKAMNTTPAQLIAAPGANKLIFVDKIIGINKVGGTPYTIPAFSQMQFHYLNGSTPKIGDLTGPFVESLGNRVEIADLTDGVGNDLNAFIDGGLFAFHTSGDPTLGDGTIELTIVYKIVDFS